jgi:hypothetical protein
MLPAPAVYAAVALLSLPEAVLCPAAGPVYLAANVFVLLAALLLLAHAAGRARPPPDAYYQRLPAAQPTRARAALTRAFLHVLCAAYVRAACWLEFRALLARLQPTQTNTQ